MNDLDFTKVNPILGYQMYNNKDKRDMRSRSAYGIDMPERRSLKTESEY